MARKLAVMLLWHDEDTGESDAWTTPEDVADAERILGAPTCSTPEVGYWYLDDVATARNAAV